MLKTGLNAPRPELPAAADGAYKPRINDRESGVTAIYLILAFVAFFAVLNLVEKGSID